jgi:hypothetical protein
MCVSSPEPLFHLSIHQLFISFPLSHYVVCCDCTFHHIFPTNWCTDNFPDTLIESGLILKIKSNQCRGQIVNRMLDMLICGNDNDLTFMWLFERTDVDKDMSSEKWPPNTHEICQAIATMAYKLKLPLCWRTFLSHSFYYRSVDDMIANSDAIISLMHKSCIERMLCG